ncbi:MAG: SurA N-terminal domain-containing protein [Proteobacteria bacterium]|nr:SurA N-terminal domain-containing protein [Pseudomonadota bacterium]
MLQLIRDKLTGWVAGIIIAVIALAFIFWGVDPLSVGATWAARVNDIEIPRNEVRRAAQDRINQFQALYQDDISPLMIEQIRSSVLERYINNALIRSRVSSNGYRVSDAMLSKSIRAMPYFQIAGEFSLDSYLAGLRSQGISKTRFEHDQRNQLEVLQLQQGLVNSSFVTPGEMRRFLELQGEEREVSLLRVEASAFADLVSPTDEEITGYYDLNAQRFLTEESAEIEYLEVRASDFLADVEVGEQALLDFYDTVAAGYQTEEQRRSRHILIAIGDNRDEAAAEARANEALERARAGEDFAALVAVYTDDGGTSADGGDLGWSSHEDFVGPFADTLFAMQIAELAGPVKTRFGYHVILLDEIMAADVRPLAEVRAEIEADYREQLAEDLYFEVAQSLGDDSFAAYDELQSVAELLGLELKSVSGFTRAGGGELGSDERIVSAVFSPEVLIDGRNSDLLEAGEDARAIVLRVTAYQQAETRPLAEVREQIVASLVSEQTRVLARSAGNSIQTAVESGASMQKLAADNNANYTAPKKVTRGTANMPRVLLAAIFSAPKSTTGRPSVGGISLATGDFTIFSVSSVTPGHPAALTIQQWNQTEQGMATQFGNAELAALVAQLHTTGKVKINQRAFDELSIPPVVP